MPRKRALRYCSMDPYCPHRLAAGEECPDHPWPDRPRRRTRTSKRGYGHDWQRRRGQVLRREPWCRHCAAEGLLEPAVEVDHIVPLRDGGARLDPANLQPLCRMHHRAKTDRETRIRHNGSRSRHVRRRTA